MHSTQRAIARPEVLPPGRTRPVVSPQGPKGVDAMRRTVETIKLVALLMMLGVTLAGSLWFGLIPQRYSPFSPLSLEHRPGWFVDLQLAFLRRDLALCQSVLKQPHIDATSIPDVPIKNGCGVVNGVRFSTAGGTRIGVDKLTCEMAAALTLWIEHEVQPEALARLGSRVASIEDMGTYDCRNIVGSKLFASRRSQHATANAIDLAAFTLEDGRKISILRNWNGNGKEAEFLRTIHTRACRYFRVALGPEYNAAHKNHFHFDRGLGWLCR